MPKSEPKLWTRDFVLIILINFLVFMNHLMILSTFPFYVEHLGGSEAMAGLAAALFSIVAVLCRPFIGWMLDCGKRKSILLVGLAGMALMPVGYLVFSVLYLAFISRLLHGASLAFSNTSTATVATDVIPQPRFAEGMGMFGLATALATACAPALGLALMDRLGFAALFLTATGCALLSLLFLALLKTPPVRVERKPLQFNGLLDKDALPASATALVFMLTYGALENFTAKFAAEQGLPSGGLFFTIMAVVLLLTRLSAGKVTDRHGESVFAYTCNLAMLAAFLLMGLVPNVYTYLLSAVLAGYGFGGLEPALQSMAVAIAPPERRGSANSTFLCAYDVGIGVGGGIAGTLISSFGYGRMFVLMSIFNLLAILIYALFGRTHPSSFTYRKKHGLL
ncbi:MAG: MFS transporter [Oscillospiraceae bacterium]|nr:MFS transporter [Oscillospiraceae bacterium]